MWGTFFALRAEEPPSWRRAWAGPFHPNLHLSPTSARARLAGPRRCRASPRRPRCPPLHAHPPIPPSDHAQVRPWRCFLDKAIPKLARPRTRAASRRLHLRVRDPNANGNCDVPVFRPFSSSSSNWSAPLRVKARRHRASGCLHPNCARRPAPRVSTTGRGLALSRF